MADASLDENGVGTLTGALNTNGSTIVRVKANAATHALKVSDGTGGSDHGPTHALHDSNGRTTLIAVSSVDGETPVAVYTDSSGNLLIDSM